MKCYNYYNKTNKQCDKKSCRYWINSKNNSNCCAVSAESGNKTLQELMDDCVRNEANNKTLVIVHETKGWMVVKENKNKLYCPRITRSGPRIAYRGL